MAGRRGNRSNYTRKPNPQVEQVVDSNNPVIVQFQSELSFVYFRNLFQQNHWISLRIGIGWETRSTREAG